MAAVAGGLRCVRPRMGHAGTQPRLWRPRRAAALRDSQFTPLRASRSPTPPFFLFLPIGLVFASSPAGQIHPDVGAGWCDRTLLARLLHCISSARPHH